MLFCCRAVFILKKGVWGNAEDTFDLAVEMAAFFFDGRCRSVKGKMMRAAVGLLCAIVLLSNVSCLNAAAMENSVDAQEAAVPEGSGGVTKLESEKGEKASGEALPDDEGTPKDGKPDQNSGERASDGGESDQQGGGEMAEGGQPGHPDGEEPPASDALEQTDGEGPSNEAEWGEGSGGDLMKTEEGALEGTERAAFDGGEMLTANERESADSGTLTEIAALSEDTLIFESGLFSTRLFSTGKTFMVDGKSYSSADATAEYAAGDNVTAYYFAADSLLYFDGNGPMENWGKGILGPGIMTPP